MRSASTLTMGQNCELAMVWMAKTGDRALWCTLGEAYVQQWATIG